MKTYAFAALPFLISFAFQVNSQTPHSAISNTPNILPDLIYFEDQVQMIKIKQKINELRVKVANKRIITNIFTKKDFTNIPPHKPEALIKDAFEDRFSEPGRINTNLVPNFQDDMVKNSDQLLKAIKDIETNINFAIDRSTQWDRNSQLGVCFINIDNNFARRIAKIALEWNLVGLFTLQVKNDNFYTTCDNCSNCIRVTTDPASVPLDKASVFTDWSAIGKEALNLRNVREATIYFKDLEKISDNESLLRNRILHEFGHALGLVHEHQSPSDINCRPDSASTIAAVIATLTTSSPGITIDLNKIVKMVVDNYVTLPHNNSYVVSEVFDSTSVMNYSLEKSFFLVGTDPKCFSISRRSDLSDGDIKYFREHLANSDLSKPPPGLKIWLYSDIYNTLQSLAELNANDLIIKSSFSNVLQTSSNSLWQIDAFINKQPVR